MAAALAALGLAAPAGAQLYSEGYQFLQAVKNREGDEATEMLNKPGTTIVNARDVSSGETGLHITVERRDLTWTEFLLQQGANPNIADNRGRTPLIAAAQIGFIEGVEALIEAGAQLDIANETGETPLIAAVHARNIELIEALVSAGADPDRADNAGRTARDYAGMPGVSGRVLNAIETAEKENDGEPDRIYGPVF
ncbi:ankyrin repeat domain-containing protein [Aurantiacibacter poecillastricola]|uniref:ankyrin repeat domain-containing protein n=1 Tax=Aurantiacibacter poecillastricola TaxID=3064385 RepID=UPI00273D1110|nr:ankyrin repeat domain-containing protein [Aurantiacibacter sp. 219JJ12-13]MDP5263191.1 ankyrin repeat domain-containing protein [Aurantiacibacter sp. 219JJ12-13]